MNNNIETILNEFDKRIKELNSYTNLMYNFIKYLALIVGCFLIIIPASCINRTTFFVNFFLIGWGLFFHIYPFLYTPEDGIMKSMYKTLRHTPIDKKDYFRIRFKKYIKCSSKVFLICIFFQSLGFILVKDYSLKALFLSIIYIIALLVLSVIEGVCLIKISIPNDK